VGRQFCTTLTCGGGLLQLSLKCLWNEIFASFFIVVLKGTA
jgi:hypothetical protein